VGTLNFDQLTVDRHPNGAPQRVRGEMPLPRAETTEAAISAFLQSNADDLKIDPKSVALVHKAETPTRRIYRYQYLVHGVPVHNAYVIVQTDRQQSVKQVESGPATDAARAAAIAPAPQGELITPKAAYDKAMANLGNVTLRQTAPEPSKIYFPTDGGLKLSYLVLIPTQSPMHDWRFFVDARTGAILKKEDIIKSMPDGSGLVFDPNPVVTANNNALRQPTATIAGGCGYAGSTVATIDAQRVTRTLKDLTLSGGVHSLDGPYARVVNISAPTSSIPTEATATNFTYSSSDERLGAVNLYYHIDTIQRYIQGLGITTANNRKTDADPAVSGFSAYYSSVDKSLHMGTSRPCHPDKSQEGDAIVHEYGHAIQDNQVPGWGATNPGTGRDETGAMGEGFGDTLACVFFANAGNQFQRETFEDWAYVENGASGLRRVDGTKVYPTDWAGEVHDDGEIWSSALWHIYRAIGGDSLTLATRQAARDALLKSVILSHHLLATDATMPDGAEAVMTTHAELDDYRGKYLVEMLNSFHDRGLLRCSASADLFMKDDTTDLGTEPFGGPVFWESPDLWVRNADDGGTSHQEPEFGQDNYFYARVKNRGTAAARAFVVTFNVKPWAGVQFVYPGDFAPFISAAVGFNLAPGASTIVKAKWPSAMIPVRGTHACLLGRVFTPVDTTPSGSHVWDKNNLAQKNMTVVDAIAGDSVKARFQIGTLHERVPDVYRIELVRPPSAAAIRVSLQATTSVETKKLLTSIDNYRPAPRIAAAVVPASAVNLAAVAADAHPAALERSARLVESASRAAEIEFNPGQVSGFPVYLQPSSQLKCTLNIDVPRDAKPGDSLKFQVVQRMSNGKIAGGITIVVNVKAR